MAKRVSDLFIPHSGCGDIDISFNGDQLTAHYEIRLEGSDAVGEAVFSGVHAFRFREERLSGGFVDGSYDALVAVEPSPWRQELEACGPLGTNLSDLTHFAILFSGNGFLEVLAATAKVSQPSVVER
jgi:hypothetical protein